MDMAKRNISLAILFICASLIATVHSIGAGQGTVGNNLPQKQVAQVSNVKSTKGSTPQGVPAAIHVTQKIRKGGNGKQKARGRARGRARTSSVGKTWCIPKLGTKKPLLLQIYREKCRPVGPVDCSPLVEGTGVCNHPNNLHWHAAFIMNNIYQASGKKDCDFGGIGNITTKDPSHDQCIFIS